MKAAGELQFNLYAGEFVMLSFYARSDRPMPIIPHLSRSAKIPQEYLLLGNQVVLGSDWGWYAVPFRMPPASVPVEGVANPGNLSVGFGVNWPAFSGLPTLDFAMLRLERGTFPSVPSEPRPVDPKYQYHELRKYHQRIAPGIVGTVVSSKAIEIKYKISPAMVYMPFPTVVDPNPQFYANGKTYRGANVRIVSRSALPGGYIKLRITGFHGLPVGAEARLAGKRSLIALSAD